MSPPPRSWSGCTGPACTASTRRPRTRSSRALRTFLHGLGISLPPGNQLHPRDLDRVLQTVAGTEQAPLVNEVVLRSQSQAAYSPDNIGHFGLALPRYAHFTSPIRRYADLLVHRALIRGLKLGPGGLGAGGGGRLRRHRRAHHRHRAPRRAGRARRDRPLSGRLHGRQGRRHLRGPHLRRAPLRPVRHRARQRRQRAGPDARPAATISGCYDEADADR